MKLAVIGAGPAGLALALLAAQRLGASTEIHLFDTRPLDRDVSGDARTLALNLGSIRLLQRLSAWRPEVAQAIQAVHVSQAPPAPIAGEVRITAAEQSLPQLGAVLPYGALVAPLQQRWLDLAATAPQRLFTRFATAVHGIRSQPAGVELDCGDGPVVDSFDLAVVAEGGVFAEQDRKSITSDYHQNAWVGTVRLAAPGLQGLAVERFTRNGPLALLPLPDDAQGARAALVWCLPQPEDDIATLNDAQRLIVIQQQLPAVAGQLTGISALKCFPLGLNAETRLLQGRTLRIGNAAQTLHPVAGQGLNLGLRDAQALVDALRDAAETGLGLDAVLNRVDWQRAPDRWPMIAATDFLARSFAWRLPGLPALRGLALAGLELATPIKNAVARRMMFGG
ncbi:MULTISPECIES: FAD-dependent monooxygenase [unclassified Roseateles]|uniref:FAD-dependent monooxygenase n=1 Tax=unclassified Roseateles TaxID=2626991 RepID=UPI0006F84AA6|nr:MULTISPECIES: FAD-dependent monooxygenase [unclassified Roseateles]KQW45787.1 2-octaprenyl-6-methoxyphenyl hydroxylase [Pelomonas sp. Root405]KRA72631.1 2-octaprenyl-6-methoxyphenyl hydroxylase [Pelomonas sp. Root662]